VKTSRWGTASIFCLSDMDLSYFGISTSKADADAFPQAPFSKLSSGPTTYRSGDPWRRLSIHHLTAELGCLHGGRCTRAQESISTAPLS